MKPHILAAALTLACGAAQAQVGVSVNVNQPGLFGRIDIGDVPAPPVMVYEQPVVIAPGPVAIQQRPIYLHVPPEHARNWRHYCQRYAACGQPVYFVQEDWYQRHYRPHFEQRQRELEHEREREWREHERHEKHEHHDERDRHHGEHRD